MHDRVCLRRASPKKRMQLKQPPDILRSARIPILLLILALLYRLFLAVNESEPDRQFTLPGSRCWWRALMGIEQSAVIQSRTSFTNYLGEHGSDERTLGTVEGGGRLGSDVLQMADAPVLPKLEDLAR